MTDERHPYAADPDPAFAGRLEQMLLDRLTVDHAAEDETDNERSMIMLDVAPRQAPPSPSHSRRSLLVAASVAALAIAAVVVALQLSRDSDTSTATPGEVPVEFDLYWPDLRDRESVNCVDTPTSYLSARALKCFRQYTDSVELTGDIEGTALWTMLGNNGVPGDSEDSAVLVTPTFTATYIVKATVNGCGTGEFMIVEHLRFDGWLVGAFSGTWDVLPGSGRDELENLAGGGTVPGDVPAEGTSQSTRTGQLTCS